VRDVLSQHLTSTLGLLPATVRTPPLSLLNRLLELVVLHGGRPLGNRHDDAVQLVFDGAAPGIVGSDDTN